MNTINLQGSPRVKHQIVGIMKPKAVLKGYLRMPTLTKLEQRKTLNATENGSYEVLPDENRTLSGVSVNVDVPIPEGYIDPEGTAIIASNGIHDITHYEFAEVNIPERKEEQEKAVEITENGTTEILPDGDKVLSKATVNVNVPIPDGYIKPEGSMPITENGTFNVREKAEVNVQVVPKIEKPYIDSSKINDFSYFFSNRTAKTGYIKPTTNNISMLKDIDTSNGITFLGMFFMLSDMDYYLDIPYFDTSNGEIFDIMFYNTKCKTIPALNTSKGTSFYQMFYNNYYIETCPALDTKNGTDFHGMFFQCKSLVTIHGELDLGNATRLNDAFRMCVALQEVRFKSIRVFDNNLNFSSCSKLTVESLLSILNALSDNTGLDTTYTVNLASANLAKLTQEQKMIALNKNIFLA